MDLLARGFNLGEGLVEEAGWYPIRVLYFEKRNTSTLQLFWLPPDSKRGLTFVPGGHFAHVR